MMTLKLMGRTIANGPQTTKVIECEGYDVQHYPDEKLKVITPIGGPRAGTSERVIDNEGFHVVFVQNQDGRTVDTIRAYGVSP